MNSRALVFNCLRGVGAFFDREFVAMLKIIGAEQVVH